MKLLTADQMRQLDRRATEEYGIPSILLMENAGLRLYEAVSEMLECLCCKNVVVVAGKGNNGGDGFCVARHLWNSGTNVLCLLAGKIDQVSGDARINLDAALKMGIPVVELDSVEHLDTAFASCNLIIDALLGTGTKGEITGLIAEIIETINLANIPVLSVDLPSGLIADTGEIAGCCVQASATVTFALPKIGLMMYPGASYVGELTVADIGIPREALEDNPAPVSLILQHEVAPLLPIRPPDAHKGTFGHLAVIAGSVGMTGAAALTAESAARSGAGLVSLGCPASLNDILEAKLTEVMTVPMPESSERTFSAASVDKALELIEKCDAVAIGPGLSRNPDTVKFIHQLLPQTTKPVVIDADGLNAMAEDVSIFAKLKVPAAITPHPGEMARLIGTPVSEIQSNRLKTALDAASKFGVICVLKGARTVIAYPDGYAYINRTGHVAMASGGVGDVLTGVIGSLLAQGLSVIDACVAAVYIHGLAGEIAAESIGVPGTLASDILQALPKAFAQTMD